VAISSEGEEQCFEVLHHIARQRKLLDTFAKKPHKQPNDVWS
jgi:hypothetical protein